MEKRVISEEQVSHIKVGSFPNGLYSELSQIITKLKGRMISLPRPCKKNAECLSFELIVPPEAKDTAVEKIEGLSKTLFTLS